MLGSNKAIITTPGANRYVVLLPANPRRRSVTIYGISCPGGISLCFGPELDSGGHIDGIFMDFPTGNAQHKAAYTFRREDIGPLIEQDVRINDAGAGASTVGAYECFEVD